MTESILIVEDNAADLARLENLLLDHGFRVACARDGADGVEMAKRILPDVILMDVNMPRMDGYAATRALRAEASTKDIPVLMVTAKDQKADIAWSQMLGAKGHIAKPFTDEQLLAQVRGL